MASTYCTETNMKDDFGTNAVNDYSSIDGDATAATRRITEAIAIAGDEIDASLRKSTHSYRLPILDASDGTSTPLLIKHIATVLATVWLYDSLGARDRDKAGQPFHALEPRRAWARETLKQIRRGEIVLDALG